MKGRSVMVKKKVEDKVTHLPCPRTIASAPPNARGLFVLDPFGGCWHIFEHRESCECVALTFQVVPSVAPFWVLSVLCP